LAVSEKWSPRKGLRVGKLSGKPQLFGIFASRTKIVEEKPFHLSTGPAGQYNHYSKFFTESSIMNNEEVWDEAHEWNRIIDEVAGKDHLTGLPNRRTYDKQIALEISRALRTSRPLSLAVLDIDKFKKVNDGYGHLAGDQVLRDLAELAKRSKRKTDFFARYGGEEFVFIFTETSLHGEKGKEDGAFHAAERFRNLAEKTLKVNDEPITISVGVTEWKKDNSPKKLFDRADQAMLQAKKAGRNRVIAVD